jgi:predicted TIM-barrel fold metal-dependent hydrolase
MADLTDTTPAQTAHPDWLDRLPEQVVDPHLHQWDPLTTTREVSREARLFRPFQRVPRRLNRLLPRADREFVGDAHHVLKPYLPHLYAEDAGVLPVGTVVHIEAVWPHEPHLESVGETRWLETLPFGSSGLPRLGGIVVHVDPRWSDAGAVLDAHAEASDKVRGVRFSAAHHPDPAVRDFSDTPAVWSEPGFLDGFAALAERGLSFELWGYAHQLPDALGLVERYPETTFVLDHFATPVGVLGPRGRHTGRYPHQVRDMLASWREDVSALAAHPNVVAKMSGLGMPVLGGDLRAAAVDLADLPRERRLVDAVAPLVQHVHASFGLERTMWASNFPMDKPTLTLPATLGILVEVLGDEADLTALTRDVASRVYRL